ncbi:MAG: hypothetical protein FJ135_02935 [Deltaproteobacteria bacterium]|nr:hypothetical protein [Deltaproteobacteria bacterium]
MICSVIISLGLGGCGTAGYRVDQHAMEQEWPTGFGTIPPSWYDYDPAYKHWYDPWYVNPYTPR